MFFCPAGLGLGLAGLIGQPRLARCPLENQKSEDEFEDEDEWNKTSIPPVY